jgi:hypothetical protein
LVPISPPVQAFYAWTGNVNISLTGASLVYTGYPLKLWTPSGVDINNIYASAVGAADSDPFARQYIYAAFRVLVNGNYNYEIFWSTNNGVSWSPTGTIYGTWGPSGRSSGSGNEIQMTLTSLPGVQMLFGYTSFGFQNLVYRVFDGTEWGTDQFTGNILLASKYKQISSTTDKNGYPYIAYNSDGNSGTLWIAKFSQAGFYTSPPEEADGSVTTHSLPSIVATKDGKLHIYSLSGNNLYDTVKTGGTWLQSNPFATGTQPVELTSSASIAAASWIQATSQLTFGNTVGPIISPIVGGTEIGVPNSETAPPGPPQCTTGFIVKNNLNNKWGLTAGHCQSGLKFDNGDQDYHEPWGGPLIGYELLHSMKTTNSDSLLFSLNDATGFGKIYQNGAPQLTVTAKGTSQFFGDTVCTIGAGSAENGLPNVRCGTVTATDVGGIGHLHTNLASFISVGGDSGSPVWHAYQSNGISAYGIAFGIQIQPQGTYYSTVSGIDLDQGTLQYN